MTVFDLFVVNQDHPIFIALSYEVIEGQVIFYSDLKTIQRSIVVNMAAIINGDTSNTCDILTQRANIPQHMVLLIFQQVVHRYNAGVYCDGVLIAKHGNNS
jgi:hypothetical protein